ncbi:MAG: acetate/propionate family kinase [Alphaproteobacteria bacterium]|nr:acetate/propionate family kinase [Alphaproteobacteria bacterium]
MRILVINAGSSSVKFSVFEDETPIFKSSLDKLEDIAAGIKQIPGILKEQGITEPTAVAHRVAHGGDVFKDACQIDDAVIRTIEANIPLAPLHNPPNLAGIRMAQQCWPDAPQVAVFDTAFHQAMPPYVTTYAVPKEWRGMGLKRYGFHGTSHKYVMHRVAEEMQTSPADLRIISCHLGNGASVCAIDRGISVDTSMGMTALEGLVMGTRSGDVDPGIFAFLEREAGLSSRQVEDILYHDSGLKALSGIGNDMRDIEQQATGGNANAQLAIQIYAYRVRKYIGAYANAMGGFDVLAFTGGIGEGSASMRARICQRMEYLGLYFDEDKNRAVKLEGFETPQLQQAHSRIRVMVTQTREQWMIAQETLRVLNDVKQRQPLPPIPVAVSAHHVHLTQAAVEQLFGKGHTLTKYKELTQPGFWAAEEKVDIIGPDGEIQNVRVLGPCREHNQIEIAETETFKLGIHADIRLSGDVKDTPSVTLRGSAGSIQTDGLIVAKRHIHMSTKDAETYGLQQGDVVEVAIDSGQRDLVFRDVAIRVHPDFVTEMHIDTDEANAAHIEHGSKGDLIPTECEVTVKRCTSHAPQTCCDQQHTKEVHHG